MLCGKSEASSNPQGYTLGGAPLLGSDPIEASRRRYLYMFNSSILIGLLKGSVSFFNGLSNESNIQKRHLYLERSFYAEFFTLLICRKSGFHKCIHHRMGKAINAEFVE